MIIVFVNNGFLSALHKDKDKIKIECSNKYMLVHFWMFVSVNIFFHISYSLLKDQVCFIVLGKRQSVFTHQHKQIWNAFLCVLWQYQILCEVLWYILYGEYTRLCLLFIWLHSLPWYAGGTSCRGEAWCACWKGDPCVVVMNTSL